MRVAIPNDVKQLVEELKMHGDFAAISKRLTISDENPLGDDTRSTEVRNAIAGGEGRFDVVKEITSFYREREEKTKALQPKKAIA